MLIPPKVIIKHNSQVFTTLNSVYFFIFYLNIYLIWYAVAVVTKSYIYRLSNI